MKASQSRLCSIGHELDPSQRCLIVIRDGDVEEWEATGLGAEMHSLCEPCTRENLYSAQSASSSSHTRHRRQAGKIRREQSFGGYILLYFVVAKATYEQNATIKKQALVR